MEWVETTAKTLEAAKDLALDRLGVAADEAEFDVLEEPRPGLFGRMRGEARVRARVMPAAVRPKQDRRGRGRRGRQERQDSTETKQRDASSTSPPTDREPATTVESTGAETESVPPSREPSDQSAGGGARRRNRPKSKQQKEQQVSTEEQDSESSVTPQEVADAAATFMTGLATAFGAEAETEIAVDGTDIDVRVTGSDLGLMVGHGGRTLIAVQDLARVASQRRLGDHDTRLRIDVAGYREKRRIALERFAVAVANEVVSSGQAKALEPMQSADRKIVHDALASVDGVTSRSEGDDPMRRVVITPS
jgi:spoIIIJ-associated protein